MNKIPLKLKEAITINGTPKWEISIPCGKCARCIQRRKMEWSFRMMIEMNESKTSYFVTLTYDPDHVPYNKYGQKTLVPRRHDDLNIRLAEQGRKRITKQWKQKQEDRSLEGFFKRLRQNHLRQKPTIEWLKNGLLPSDIIKYYAAGEYGEERGRPHYHAIIFNASLSTIEKSWTLGSTHIVPANENTISYVMKYLDKRLDKEQDWKKIQEFNTMSEGIGASYILKNKEWHKRNIDILYVTTPFGIRIPMPKYYREKIFSDIERQTQVQLVEEALNDIRTEMILEHGHHEYNEHIRMSRDESEKRFRKKMKKRIVD